MTNMTRTHHCIKR